MSTKKEKRLILFDDLDTDSEKSEADNQRNEERCSMSPVIPAAAPEGSPHLAPALLREVTTVASITGDSPYEFSQSNSNSSRNNPGLLDRRDPVHDWLSTFHEPIVYSPISSQSTIDTGTLDEPTSSSPSFSRASSPILRTPSGWDVMLSNDQNNDRENDDHFSAGALNRPPAAPLQFGNTIDCSGGEELIPSFDKDGCARFRGNRFQLTLNQINKWEDLKRYIKKKNLEYGIACHENAPSTGHNHIHVFLLYKRSVDLYKKSLCGAHVEKCRADNYSNMKYIKKNGDIIWEEGSAPTKHFGRKITVREALDMNADQMMEINVNQLRHVFEARRIMRNESKLAHPYFKFPTVIWAWGPTGTGKSWDANHTEGIISLSYSGRFFTSFTFGTKFLIDDFRGQIPYNLLLNLADQYQNTYKFEIKGGHDVWECELLWITSSMPPEWVYRQQVGKVDSINQLLRRITEIRHYTSQGEYTSESGMEHVIMPYPVDPAHLADINNMD